MLYTLKLPVAGEMQWKYLSLHLTMQANRNIEQYHKAPGDVIPYDVYFARRETILKKRSELKKQTLAWRRAWDVIVLRIIIFYYFSHGHIGISMSS